MNYKNIIIGLIVIIGLISVVFLVSQKSQTPTITPNDQEAATSTSTNSQQMVKEFTMTSFVEMVDGKPKPQYSLKEITVKKGDLVRLKITVTKGTHDLKLDEFKVQAETPLNQETVVEFIADQVGQFIYYCSMPGHRAAGHWGTLIVTD